MRIRLTLLMTLALLTLRAQVETTTSIGGTVTDASGAVSVGASVTLVNKDTGAVRNSVSNNDGVYYFGSLPAGTYNIKVSMPGFKTATVEDRVALTAQPARVDVVLQIGDTTESVTVSARGEELVNTASAEVTGNINPRLVQDIPLGRGNFFDMLQVTPGVVPQNLSTTNLSFAGASLNFVSAGNTFMSSGAFIAGNRDSATNVSVDGSNVQIPVYQQATQIQARADIQEVRVETANLSAEFGNGVNAVNVITKSGSNAFHGELYEYFRNSALDANTYFNNLAGRTKPPYGQNQYGAAVGGPIRKNKLFFFSNYEAFDVHQNSQQFEVVPDANLRQGDFSNYHPQATGNTLGPVPIIYNPYQTTTAGLRVPFPGNKIPLAATSLCAPRPTCADPATLAYLQKYVLPPNTVINGVPELTGQVPTTMTSKQVTGRLDWIQSAKTIVYGRYTFTNINSQVGGLQPLEGTYNPSSAQNAVLHWTQVPSPTLVNDFSVSYSRPHWDYSRPLNQPDVASEIGVLNTSGYPGGPSWSLPNFSLGNTTSYIYDAFENKIQGKDDLSFIRGHHVMKFGAETTIRRFIYYDPSGDKGQFTFGTYFSTACPLGNNACEAARAASGAPEGGNAFADYLLGGFSSDLLINRQIPYVGHQTYLGFYALDSWRVTPRLTINYGLRYEYWSPWLVPRNTTATFNFQTGQLSYALQNPLDFLDKSKCFGSCAPLTSGQPRESYSVGNRDFAPRLGITYALRPSTIIRAGAGIYYDGNINMNQFNDIQTGVSPFNPRIQVSQDTSAALPAVLVSQQYPAGATSSVVNPHANPPQTFRFPMSYYPTAAVYQWSFSLQQKLGSSWGAEANYIGSHTIHEFQFIDVNAAALPQGALASVPLQQRRPYPQWGTLGTWAPIGWAKYDALTVSIRNNSWHGLTLISNFSWAKNLSTSSVYNSDQGQTNFRAPYMWAGPSNLTPKLWAIASLSYALPFGHGKHFTGPTNPILSTVVSDWTVSTVVTMATGSPQPVLANDNTGTSSQGLLMAQRVCDPNSGANLKTRLEWFNSSCFTNPPFGVYPNSPLGAVTDPGINNWNVSLIKRIPVKFPVETGAFELRGDFLNSWNHTQWGASDKNVNSPTYGQITSTRPPRQVQVALNYTF